MRKVASILGITALLLSIPVHTSIMLIRDAGGGGGGFEQVLPNAASAPAGNNFWRCTSAAEVNDTGCDAADDSDEGYQGTYDGNSTCNDENVTPTTEEARFDFPTPSASPVATTDAQTIRVAVTKTNATCGAYVSAGDNPTFDLYVYDGSSLQLLINDYTCSSDQEELTPVTWTYVGGSDGSEVYVEVFDNGNGQIGTSRRRCAIEAIDWYAEVGGGGGSACNEIGPETTWDNLTGWTQDSNTTFTANATTDELDHSDTGGVRWILNDTGTTDEDHCAIAQITDMETGTYAGPLLRCGGAGTTCLGMLAFGGTTLYAASYTLSSSGGSFNGNTAQQGSLTISSGDYIAGCISGQSPNVVIEGWVLDSAPSSNCPADWGTPDLSYSGSTTSYDNTQDQFGVVAEYATGDGTNSFDNVAGSDND